MTPEEVQQQEAQLHDIALSVRNWGKWGPDDELGTLNYITPDAIAQAAQLDVTVQRGDLLLIRTGHLGTYVDKGSWDYLDLDDSPGVSVPTAPWMHAKEIAAVGCDNYAVEVRPSEIPLFRAPFHCCAIPNMGLTLGEIFYLEALAEDCAQDGRYAFLLVAPPLPFTHAVGTPINPYAMK